MKKLTIPEIKRSVAPLAKKYQIDKVWVFGSVARQTNTSDSDLDIIIERSSGNAIDKYNFLADLEDSLGVEIDMINNKSLELKENKEVSGIFIHNLNRDKELVYG